MFFIQRAFKYLKMKLGKTLLMGIIFLVIANFVLAGLLVQNASQKAQDNTRIAIGTDISYIPNYDTFLDAINKGVLDRKEMVRLKSNTGFIISEAIADGGGPTYGNFMTAVNNEYVASYNFEVAAGVQTDHVTAYQLEQSAATSYSLGIEFFGSNEPKDFLDKTSTLVEGRLPNKEEIEQGTPVIVIEERVLNQNNLRVGDEIMLTYSFIENETVELSHEIIGVYTTTETADQFAISNGNVAGYPMNKVYTPFSVVSTVGMSDEDLSNVMLATNEIRLNDPSELEKYRLSLESLINFEYGTLDANDELYNSLVGPIESIGLISNVLVASIVITGGFIIGLITALTINDRKGEIGILLAVGESKLKIVSQFVLEVVLIAVIAFSISLFTGEIIGEKLSASVLDSELFGAVEEPKQVSNRKNGFVNTKAPLDDVAEFDLSLDISVMVQLFSMGLILTVVSTAIPSLYVMRFNPKQILTNRNS